MLYIIWNIVISCQYLSVFLCKWEMNLFWGFNYGTIDSKFAERVFQKRALLRRYDVRRRFWREGSHRAGRKFKDTKKVCTGSGAHFSVWQRKIADPLFAGGSWKAEAGGAAGLYLIEELALNAFAVKRVVIERDDFLQAFGACWKKEGVCASKSTGWSKAKLRVFMKR